MIDMVTPLTSELAEGTELAEEIELTEGTLSHDTDKFNN